MWLYSHGFEDTFFKNMVYDSYICIYLHEMLPLKQGHLQPNAFLQRDKIKLYSDGKSSVLCRTLDLMTPGHFWPYHPCIYYS